MARAGLRVVVGVGVVRVVSVVLGPLLSRGDRSQASNERLVVARFRLQFFSLLYRAIASFSILCFRGVVLPIFCVFFSVFMRFLVGACGGA